MSEQVVSSQAPEKTIHYNCCIEEILALIKGRAPLIWVVTHEETRFIADFVEQVAEPHKRKVWLWSAYQGLIPQEQQQTVVRAAGEEKETHNPQKALQRIAGITKTGEGMKGHCFILRDFHTVLGEPIPRQIRDMYDHLIGEGKTLIITGPLLAHGPGGGKPGLPPTLEKQISVVRYELPNKTKISSRINEVIDHMKESIKGKKKQTKLEYQAEEIESFTKALQGLTMIEVDTSLSTSITYLNRLDVEKLINDKRQIIRKSEILEFIDAPVAMKDVGGMDLAKIYLQKYSTAYSEEAEEFGVEPLKGILLTGVPGCLHGKTKIYDPVTDTNTPVEERFVAGEPFYVYSSDRNRKQVVAQALPPIQYPKAEMLELETNLGEKITVTKGHRLLTSQGWMSAQDVASNIQQFGEVLLPSSWDNIPLAQTQDAQRSKKTTGDFLAGCRPYLYSYDVLLHEVKDISPDALPSPNDAHGRNPGDSDACVKHRDAHVAHGQECSRAYHSHGPLSKPDFSDHNAEELEPRSASKTHRPYSGKYEVAQQSPSEEVHPYTSQQPLYPSLESKPAGDEGASAQPYDSSRSNPCAVVLRLPPAQEQMLHDDNLYVPTQQSGQSSCPTDIARQLSASVLPSTLPLVPSRSDSTKYTRLIKSTQVEDDIYYDFHVPGYHNYAASGIYHHNTGKSLLAKAIGKLWKVPLLRLDVGKVMSGLVGSSEEKMRQVINQAEAMAPTVCWIDEVEKSLSGTKSSNMSDGGTLARVFGTLLTAMQDGMEGVTIVATANDITMLPPEFIRRFNEVFFVDLPGPDERWEIFDIHLAKRGRKIASFEKHKKSLLNASTDYTGAEIEKAIKDAIAAAFYEGKKDVTHKHIADALKDTKPISQVMKKKVDKLRETARGQYRYASSWAVGESKKREIKTSGGKKLDIDKAVGNMSEFAKPPKKKAKEEAAKADNRFGNLVEEADEKKEEK